MYDDAPCLKIDFHFKNPTKIPRALLIVGSQ